MVRTTRNSAFPLIMRAYPSAAFASGYFSIIGRTPVISANRRVSCESVGMPPAQPLMPFLPKVDIYLTQVAPTGCGRRLLDEFTFCFNRRRSGNRGKLFYRLAQQGVAIDPAPYTSMIKCSAVALAATSDDHNL